MLIQINNIKLNYEKTGSGPALLMLHGNGESLHIFDKAVSILAKHYTVYAIDTRGHGKSENVTEFHYMDMAKDVKCFIRALDLSHPLLYGFSDGGIVGLLLACYSPSLLSRLIISGANLVPDGLICYWRVLFRFFHAIHPNPLYALMLREPNITLEMLQQITIPVTVFAGSRDMVKRAHTISIAESIPHCTLRILKGETHGSYIVQSEKIAHLILGV